MKSISYIGCDDRTLDLFEGLYALPDGMCYNSYLLCADKPFWIRLTNVVPTSG